MAAETMTLLQAEEIWMANQVGDFRGLRSDLAIATLLLTNAGHIEAPEENNGGTSPAPN